MILPGDIAGFTGRNNLGARYSALGPLPLPKLRLPLRWITSMIGDHSLGRAGDVISLTSTGLRTWIFLPPHRRASIGAFNGYAATRDVLRATGAAGGQRSSTTASSGYPFPHRFRVRGVIDHPHPEEMAQAAPFRRRVHGKEQRSGRHTKCFTLYELLFWAE